MWEVVAHDTAQREAGFGPRQAQVINGGNGGGVLPLPTHVGGLTNEQLAHELLLNKDFRLTEQGYMSSDELIQTRIRAMFEAAFWESLVEDLTTPPASHGRILTVLLEIKTSIVSLTVGHPEAEQIAEIIDIELVTQQLARGVLDHQECENLFGAIIRVVISAHDRMQNPGRRQETLDEWATARDRMIAASNDDNIVERSRAMCSALEVSLNR